MYTNVCKIFSYAIFFSRIIQCLAIFVLKRRRTLPVSFDLGSSENTQLSPNVVYIYTVIHPAIGPIKEDHGGEEIDSSLKELLRER